MIGARFAWVLAALLALIVVAAFWHRQQRDTAALDAVLRGVRQRSTEPELACAQLSAGKPLVLLALGQSNAGNHGELSASSLAAVTLVVDDHCVLAQDPLPGATGNGGSIWRRLPDALARQGVVRPVVLSVFAVDGTAIDAWTDARSPVRQRLEARVMALRKLGLVPGIVLWQHGEADAHAGTGARAYADRLEQLRTLLTDAGVRAPILLARSTTCRSAADPAVRSAIEAAAAEPTHFALGPDTDLLQGARYRPDSCHFSVEGLNAAAKMWAERVKAQLSPSAL
jgi:hypothetical protein